MSDFQTFLAIAQDHITPGIVITLTAASVIMAVSSIFLIPVILCRLPADYFLSEKPHLMTRIKFNAPVKSFVLVIKNFFGLILFLAGFLMLFLPGQGLLTMLIGMVLIDFPGKFKLERRIIAKPKVLAAVNWLRARRGQPRLIV